MGRARDRGASRASMSVSALTAFRPLFSRGAPAHRLLRRMAVRSTHSRSPSSRRHSRRSRSENKASSDASVCTSWTTATFLPTGSTPSTRTSASRCSNMWAARSVLSNECFSFTCLRHPLTHSSHTHTAALQEILRSRRLCAQADKCDHRHYLLDVPQRTLRRLSVRFTSVAKGGLR